MAEPGKLRWDTATADEVLDDIRAFRTRGYEALGRHPMQDPTLAAIKQDEEDAQTLAQHLTSFSNEFDEMIEARHKMGAEKYGPGKFLTVDTIEEALQELADLANYCRYTFIKLRMLQEAILVQGVDSGAIDGEGFLGPQTTFKRSGT